MHLRRDVYERNVIQVFENQVVFTEGETGKAMYVIIDGEVEIIKKTSSLSSKTLTTLKRGDVFGEMALIDSLPRSASAIVKKAGRLLVMDQNLFFTLAKNNADFAFKMIKVLSDRIRRSNEQISKLASENRDVRTLKGLAEFAGEYGRSSIHGLRVEKAAFTEWAERHLGLPASEIQASLNALIAKRTVVPGALPAELILPRRVSDDPANKAQ